MGSATFGSHLESTPLLTAQPSKASGLETVGGVSDGFPATLKGKKVLLASESLGPINGVSRTTSMLIEYLRQNGVEVAVVAPQIKSKMTELKPGLRVDVRLNGYALPYNPDLTVAYAFNIHRLFRRTFQPDLVYLASPASVGFQAMVQLRHLHNGPPVICNFQTDLTSYGDIIFPSRMAEYSALLLGLVQGYLFRHPSVHTVFYPCGLIRKYIEGLNVQQKKLVHLGRGVDTEMFHPGRCDEEYRKELAPNGEVIFATVSRLAPEKGFEFLSKATIKLAEAGLSFKLLIVGGNRNSSVEAEVQKYFDPIKDRVLFTGFLTGTSLARAYATADIFLHCSTTETFGLVVLEAMASGLPVVARDQGGPSDIVREGKTGYLTSPDDLEEFISKTKKLCEFKDVRAEFARTSREIALQTTWEKINDQAATQMATVIEKHIESLSLARRQRDSWPLIWRLVYDVRSRLVLPVWEHLKLIFAIGVVTVFWIIAVVPLILYGALLYRTS